MPLGPHLFGAAITGARDDRAGISGAVFVFGAGVHAGRQGREVIENAIAIADSIYSGRIKTEINKNLIQFVIFW